MALAFESVSNSQSGTGTTFTLTWTGSASGQARFVVIGYEGTTLFGHSNGYVSAAPSGWYRVGVAGEVSNGGTASVIEVWAHDAWASGTTSAFTLSASKTFIARGVVVNGNSPFADAFPLVGKFGSLTGTTDNPTSTATNYIDQLSFDCLAGQFAAGPGTPAVTNSFTATPRFDDARSGAGTIEITAADWGPETSTSNSGRSETATWTVALSPAAKRWASMRVTILAFEPLARIYFIDPSGSPGEFTNPTKDAQVPTEFPSEPTLASHLDFNVGNGWFVAPDGNVLRYGIQAGSGVFVGGITTSNTVGGTGEGSAVAISNTLRGATRVRASAAPTVMGSLLAVATGSSHTADDGMDAIINFYRTSCQAQII